MLKSFPDKRRGSSSVERSPEEAGVVSSTLTRGTALRSDLSRNYAL